MTIEECIINMFCEPIRSTLFCPVEEQDISCEFTRYIEPEV